MVNIDNKIILYFLDGEKERGSGNISKKWRKSAGAQRFPSVSIPEKRLERGISEPVEIHRENARENAREKGEMVPRVAHYE